jgi:hypothetical protein
MLTLTQAQKQTLAAILADEVQSQREDPTAPTALDEAVDLARALERGEDLNPFTLARVLADEATMRVAMVREAIELAAFDMHPIAGDVARRNVVPLRLAVDGLARLGGATP